MAKSFPEGFDFSPSSFARRPSPAARPRQVVRNPAAAVGVGIPRTFLEYPMAGKLAFALARGATVLLTLLSVTIRASAQTAGTAHRHDAAPAAHTGSHTKHDTEAAADPSHAVHDAMSGAMGANPHMRMSPIRVASPADSARAAQIVDRARTALTKYKDVRVAEREGYRMFAPGIKNQPVYHFTNLRLAIRERFKFDPTQPSSLLYKTNPDGSLRLVGAMYTAPKDATPEELNARVPLGIAQWHLHTNMCVPRLTQTARWKEVSNGRPVFGPTSAIATSDACDKVNGKFLPVVFNWMVHANLYEPEVWADHH